MALRLFVCVAAFCSAVGPSVTARAQWLPTYQNYSIQRLGLFGPDQTSSTGVQSSTASFFNGAGFVAGYSRHYLGSAGFSIGSDAWAWNGSTTTHIGLVGEGYTGSTGFQFSTPRFQNDSGQVAGISRRITAIRTSNGQDAWVWNGTTTMQIGLSSTAHTGSAGYRYSSPGLQNASGQVAGVSQRITGVNTDNGSDAWVSNGTTTTQIGFIGAGYIGGAGYRYSSPGLQNASGQVAGISKRITGVDTFTGSDAWVWNGTTTMQIGLTGPGYAGSVPALQSASGQVAGISQRITAVNTGNGEDAWVWNSTTTTRIGLTGPGYTGSAGYRESGVQLQNAAGQVAGVSARITSVNTNNGRDAWVWNGTTTTQIGLTGAGYTGSAGYRLSALSLQNATGQVAGVSVRVTGVDTDNGRDAWVWNGTTTTQIGLTGPANTGSAGYRESWLQIQNVSGQVAGYSTRYSGVNTYNGADAWVWNGAMTTQIGLTGAGYVGSAGYQETTAQLQNAAGQVAGVSSRITGVDTNNGYSTWYFDPATRLTSAVIGSIRISDDFASSVATILTDDGFLLGNYQFFAGGLGDGEQRAFIFRPDLGLTDLGNLVNGGLTPNGWSTLQTPLFSDALRTIVGHGYVNGQTSGQSVFVMVPAPGAAALVALGGLMAARRRRSAAA